MRYLHTTIHVRDLKKSVHFYEKYVGLKIMNRIPAGDGEIVFLANQSGETEIELIHIPNQPAFGGTGISIGFETDNVDRDYQAALENQLNPSNIHSPNPEIRFFFISDPDGVLVQLAQNMRL